MSGKGWVVVAKVGESGAAKRTDSCGDMEQLELMELILVSEHDTKEEAEAVASRRQSDIDGWLYAVMLRAEYEKNVGSATPRAA
jgi:hypothetical protein